MSLQSERAAADGAAQAVPAGFPARWMGTCSLRKEVARLEFFALGQKNEDLAEAETEGMKVGEVLCSQEASDANDTAIVEDVAAQIEAAKQEVRRETNEEWEKELQQRVVEERGAVRRSCEQFRRERARYFAGVEPEVVKLALAIAARVLHREVKLDPLLLTAAVRVALEKVAVGSSTIVRVPSADVARWREVLGEALATGVELSGEVRLAAGECVLETSVGKVDLGVEAQLAEIEQGFFDLLQKRP